MGRLILFSGGVESTALLTIANRHNDMALFVNDTSHHLDRTADMNAAANVLRAMAFPMLSVDLCVWGGNLRRRPFVQQMWSFMAACSLVLAKHDAFNEIWYGMHRGEPNEVCRHQHYAAVHGFEKAHGVHVTSPLIRETKEQQWERIPAHVRPLVRNCFTADACGTCKKCAQLKQLPGSFWATQRVPCEPT